MYRNNSAPFMPLKSTRL